DRVGKLPGVGGGVVDALAQAFLLVLADADRQHEEAGHSPDDGLAADAADVGPAFAQGAFRDDLDGVLAGIEFNGLAPFDLSELWLGHVPGGQVALVGPAID